MPFFIDPTRMVIVESNSASAAPSSWAHVDDHTASACRLVDGQTVSTRQAAALRAGLVASFAAADPSEGGPTETAGPRAKVQTASPRAPQSPMTADRPSLLSGVLILLSCVLAIPFVLYGFGLMLLGRGFCGDRISSEVEACESGATGGVVIYVVVFGGLLLLGFVVGIRRIVRALGQRGPTKRR